MLELCCLLLIATIISSWYRFLALCSANVTELSASAKFYRHFSRMSRYAKFSTTHFCRTHRERKASLPDVQALIVEITTL